MLWCNYGEIIMLLVHSSNQQAKSVPNEISGTRILYPAFIIKTSGFFAFLFNHIPI